jgi:DNA-binding IclR family transcriptional regulator
MSNKGVGPSAEGSSAPSGVQSVDRAISVLEYLAREGESGVSEVAAALEVHRSTAFRLLGALEARGYVEQPQERGKYSLGFGVVRLASAVSGQLDVTRQAGPVCDRLATEIGETMNVAVLEEHYAVHVSQRFGPSAVTTHNWVGQLTPLHATASGKVLLAHVSVERRNDLLRRSELEPFTSHTFTNRTDIEKELSRCLERGFAVVHEEFEIGLNAIAVPIRDADGSVIASVSASGPAYRFDDARMQDVTPSLIAGAAEISYRLGYLGS